MSLKNSIFGCTPRGEHDLMRSASSPSTTLTVRIVHCGTVHVYACIPDRDPDREGILRA